MLPPTGVPRCYKAAARSCSGTETAMPVEQALCVRVRTDGKQWEAQQVHDADLGNHGRVQVGVLHAPGHMVGCIRCLLDSGSRHIACRLALAALQALIDRAPTCPRASRLACSSCRACYCNQGIPPLTHVMPCMSGSTWQVVCHSFLR